MSTLAAGRFQGPCFHASNAALNSARLPGSLLLTAIIIGLVFFVAGHDFFTSRAIAYTQSAEEMQSAALGGNFLRRIAFLVLAGWGLALLAQGTQPLKIAWPLTTSLGVLLALAAASVLWTAEPAMCLRRLLVLVCSLVAAAGIARAFSLREMAWLVVMLVASLATIGVAAEIVLGTFRPWAGDYRFAGTVHPNTQGPALAALCIAVVALQKDSNRYRAVLWSVFAVSLLLLLLTKSRTSAAALLAALAAIPMVKLPLRTQFIAACAGAWLLAVSVYVLCVCGFDPAADFRDAMLLGRSDESESLTGRAFIWPEVIRYARERFWLGYGYEAFWTPTRIEAISDELGWGLREAHNGYLEMWLWLGAVGLGLLLLATAVAIVAAARGLRATNDLAYLLPLGLLMFGLVDSCLESGMVVISMVPFLLMCCVMRLALFRDSPVMTTDQ